MKLLRYGPEGHEKPGMLDGDGRIRDLSAIIADINPQALSPESIGRLRGMDTASLPLIEGKPRLGACVTGVSKLVCVGLNYTDHAQETGAKVPSEPVLFLKATSAICGPDDPVIIPKDSVKSDWEVELGIVIGSRASHVSIEEAMDYIAGYCVVNDVSEREFQLERGGNWSKGKSSDHFAPLGPWLVTKDEIPDPQDLALFCEVNGQCKQDGTTRNMVFGVAEIVSYISRFMTLLPGDVIPTGTPAGVGLGHKPPLFLKPGDTLRLGVSGLGEQNQQVIAYAASA